MQNVDITQGAACAEAVAALKAAGRLDPVGIAALVGLVTGLAEQVDGDPGDSALWREYRMAWKELRGATAVDSTDDTIDKALAGLTALGGATEVRNTA